MAKHLSKRFQVKILDVRSPPADIDNFTFGFWDVRNYTQVLGQLEDVDLVIHTAIIQIPQINEQRKLAYEVNVIGTQNVYNAVENSPKTKGMILAGTWHTIGEWYLKGVIDESFGFRPDKVKDRARLYALSKIAQESIVRIHDEISDKVFGIIRMGTVLGEGMPEKTAANLFVENGLSEKPLTPYRQSIHRPMLYVDIVDVCRAYENFASRILSSDVKEKRNSLTHIFNVYYPDPITIFQLVELVRDSIRRCSDGRMQPKIEVLDDGKPTIFNQEDRTLMKVDASKALNLLGSMTLTSPKESIENPVRARMKKRENLQDKI